MSLMKICSPRLGSILSIIPEPTGALESSWIVNNVHQLSFDLPAPGGIQGDIVVLEETDCLNSYLRDSIQTFPINSSAKAVLQSDGIAREYAIAQGKFNELRAGTYKICYATRTSGGEAFHDFRFCS